MAQPPSSPAWLCVACPPGGGPACPGRHGARGGVGRGGGPLEGGGVACASPPRGCGKARTGLGGIGAGGLGAAVPSLCLPYTGTKAGLVGVAQFMEGALSILLRFVSVCFHPGAAQGGRHGAAWCPGGPPAGWTGRLGAPLPLERASTGLHACVAACGGYRGCSQGAPVAWTRLCVWPGSQGGRRGGGRPASQPGGGGPGGLYCGGFLGGLPAPAGLSRAGGGCVGYARVVQSPRHRCGSLLCCPSGSSGGRGAA